MYFIVSSFSFHSMKWWVFIFCVINIATVRASNPTPIVLWHGMGDTCCGGYSLGGFKTFLEREIPGVYVLSLRIGNSVIEDFENSYFMYTNTQIEYACKVLAADAKLQNGFNAIGFSQGSQFLRAVVQRCGHKVGPVKNLITLGGQHQGVYGLPHCGALSHKTCDYIRELLNYAAYQSWLQRSLVQATYWHDPLNEDVYKKSSQFLSDVNNELSINQTYVDNLYNLDHFVMVLFENDTIAQPKESSWFGFYRPGQSKALQTLQQSRIYKQDRLGLKRMDKAGKLVFLSSPGDHLQFSEEWFINNIIANYLAPK